MTRIKYQEAGRELYTPEMMGHKDYYRVYIDLNKMTFKIRDSQGVAAHGVGKTRAELQKQAREHLKSLGVSLDDEMREHRRKKE